MIADNFCLPADENGFNSDVWQKRIGIGRLIANRFFVEKHQIRVMPDLDIALSGKMMPVGGQSVMRRIASEKGKLLFPDQSSEIPWKRTEGAGMRQNVSAVVRPSVPTMESG